MAWTLTNKTGEPLLHQRLGAIMPDGLAGGGVINETAKDKFEGLRKDWVEINTTKGRTEATVHTPTSTSDYKVTATGSNDFIVERIGPKVTWTIINKVGQDLKLEPLSVVIRDGASGSVQTYKGQFHLIGVGPQTPIHLVSITVEIDITLTNSASPPGYSVSANSTDVDCSVDGNKVTITEKYRTVWVHAAPDHVTTVAVSSLETGNVIFGIDTNSDAAQVRSSIDKLAKTNVPDWVWNDAVDGIYKDYKNYSAKRRAGKVQFVGLYLGRNLTNVDMVKELCDAGLQVVSYYEILDNDAILTKETGHDHGTKAWEEALKLSQPLGTPVYFAVDFGPKVMSKVTDYFEGVRRSLNELKNKLNTKSDPYGIGVYGQPEVINYCRANSTSTGQPLATWFLRCGLVPSSASASWPGENLVQLYGYTRYYNDLDPEKHYIYTDPKTGKTTVNGEKFCGLSVDFCVSDAVSLDKVGAWSQLSRLVPSTEF